MEKGGKWVSISVLIVLAVVGAETLKTPQLPCTDPNVAKERTFTFTLTSDHELLMERQFILVPHNVLSTLSKSFISSISIVGRSSWVHHILVYQNGNLEWGWEHSAKDYTFHWPKRKGLFVSGIIDNLIFDVHMSSNPTEETFVSVLVSYSSQEKCWGEDGKVENYFSKSRLKTLFDFDNTVTKQSRLNPSWTAVSSTIGLRYGMEVFAFRVHAHTHGQIVTATVTNLEGKSTDLLHRSAQEPQIFTLLPSVYQLEKGSNITITCNYNFPKEEREELHLGFSVQDEMCTMYLMYTCTLERQEPRIHNFKAMKSRLSRRPIQTATLRNVQGKLPAGTGASATGSTGGSMMGMKMNPNMVDEGDMYCE
eukprot:CAMPEP_0119128260 /NCGR_PEP_ID=MMETSP1310-20130426/6486_1 /TAXON_ID=464262 /ORGANISM="Genus nov. species nov., Strain RCC2339" /LENGTH=365 /DNA_ID=CAMNT_0007118587 /DNA_START=1 /DNA_END=1098 /DNA_ORIENTATION=+